MKQHTWQTHHTVDIHTQVIIHKTQWQSHHTWHIYIYFSCLFLLLLRMHLIPLLSSLLPYPVILVYLISSFSFLFLSLRAAAVASRVCFLLSCVSLRFFSYLLLSSSFLSSAVPGELAGGEIRGRIDETDRHLTVCVMNRSRCWGTSLAICFCFCPIHDPTVPSLSVHIT